MKILTVSHYKWYKQKSKNLYRHTEDPAYMKIRKIITNILHPMQEKKKTFKYQINKRDSKKRKKIIIAKQTNRNKQVSPSYKISEKQIHLEFSNNNDMKKSSHSPNSRGSVLRLIAEKTVWKKKKKKERKANKAKQRVKKLTPK